ncbi:hypothetical protein BSAF29S_03686 [Bacillus safensis subsp. safensis]
MDHRRKQVVSISLITAFALIGDSMLYIVLPIYWKKIGLSSIWEVGLLLSINRFIRIPLTPVVWWLYRFVPMNWCIDRYFDCFSDHDAIWCEWFLAVFDLPLRLGAGMGVIAYEWNEINC